MFEQKEIEAAQRFRHDLTTFFYQPIKKSMHAIKIKMDEEIEQEIRERIAVLIFDEMVNDMPMIPYMAVWEDGADEIVHAYISPKIEKLCGYAPSELQQIGYNSIVKGDIISYFREISGVEKKISPVSEVREKRIAGFLENRNWEGCYRIETKTGSKPWVIDRSTITRFRNNITDNIICISCGILLETTELLEKQRVKRVSKQAVHVW